MADSENSQVQAKVWLKPAQVDALRTACYETGASYLQQLPGASRVAGYRTWQDLSRQVQEGESGRSRARERETVSGLVPLCPGIIVLPAVIAAAAR